MRPSRIERKATGAGNVEIVLYSFVTGAGATALIDLWALLRRRAFGTAAPNYALVGRWLAHLPRGRFRHDAIGAAAPVRAERAIGWLAHYAIGIGFAALLLGLQGTEWIRHPTPGPALAVGIATVLAPFLIMQPGMGAGVFARRTPRPNAARVQSLVTHTIFGVGLYATAWLARLCLVA